MLSLSIIIPSHYRQRQLQNCVESIFKQQVNCRIEILACINQDDHESLKFLESQTLPQNIALRVIPVCKASVNSKRNEGWRHCCGQLIHFLDDDCLLPDPYFYSRVIDYTSSCTVPYFGGHYQSQTGDRNIVSHFYNWWSKTWLKLHRGKVLLGGNFFTDRSIDVHFNEDIEYGGAETEFFLRQPHRFWPLNEKLYVHHTPNVSFRSLLSKILRQNLGPKVAIHYPTAMTVFLKELFQKPLFTVAAMLIFLGLLLHRGVHSVILFGKTFEIESD